MRNMDANSTLLTSAKTVGVVYGMLGLSLLAILPVVGLVHLQGEWMDGVIVLVIPVLTLATLRGSARHLAVTAWYGGLVGFLLVALGIGHLVGITSLARGAVGVYDSRHVFRITIGGILICTGLVDLGTSGAIKRGALIAIALAAFRTVALVAFLGLLLPLPDGGSNTSGFLVLNVAYLTLLTFAWLRQPKNRRGPTSSLVAV